MDGAQITFTQHAIAQHHSMALEVKLGTSISVNFNQQYVFVINNLLNQTKLELLSTK